MWATRYNADGKINKMASLHTAVAREIFVRKYCVYTQSLQLNTFHNEQHIVRRRRRHYYRRHTEICFEFIWLVSRCMDKIVCLLHSYAESTFSQNTIFGGLYYYFIFIIFIWLKRIVELQMDIHHTDTQTHSFT